MEEVKRKKILVVDVCVRGDESRTARLLDAAYRRLKADHPEWEFEILRLPEMHLSYLDQVSLKERDRLLLEKNYDHPRFHLARQFQEADGIIVAAPFWDLAFPAMLKVYIENVSVDGLTFFCDEQGLHGMCRAEWMLHLTTRGGIWTEAMRQDESYLRALCTFFGIDSYHCISAEGIDIEGLDREKILADAIEETEKLCRTLH